MKTRIKHRQRVIIGLIVAAVIVVLVGSILFLTLHHSAEEDTRVKKNNVITLSRRDLTNSISATGTVNSADSKTVSANVTNLTVKKVNVQVGDSVKKGDTLMVFDESDLTDALADAKENLTVTQSDTSRSIASATQQLADARETYSYEAAQSAKAVSAAKKSVSEATSQVQTIKKQIKATTDAAKKKELQEQLTKAQEAKSQAQTSYENAVSNQKSSARQNKTSIRNAENSLETARSTANKSMKEAENQVEEAQKKLKNCSVTAPISGIITTVNVENGNTYNGGTMFQIDDTSSFTVTTTVDEYDISSISLGQQAVIMTEATDKQEIQGEISFVAPSTTSTSNSSSNSTGDSGASMGSSSSSSGYEVTIDITDSNDKLKMGLTAKCSIILEKASQVYAVPYDAIHENDYGDSVIYVAKDENNTEQYDEVAVTKGMESDYYVEINGDDLQEGMYVIIPTDETEEPSQKDSSEQKGFDFGGQNMRGGDMGGGNKGFRNGNGGGNAPGGPGN